MRPRLTLVVLLGGALLAACDANTNEDALPGSWLRMRTESQLRDQYIFRDDGTFEFNENKPDAPQDEDHLVGTYVAQGDVVTATVQDSKTPAKRARLTFSYYADESQFSTGALRAPAGHAGAVGVWTGFRKVELLEAGSSGPSGGEVEADLRADGTYRWTYTPFDGTAAIVADGTWVTTADGKIQTSNAAGAGQTFLLLGDQALVDEPRVWRRWLPD